MFKKIIAALLILTLTVSFSACDSNNQLKSEKSEIIYNGENFAYDSNSDEYNNGYELQYYLGSVSDSQYNNFYSNPNSNIFLKSTDEWKILNEKEVSDFFEHQIANSSNYTYDSDLNRYIYSTDEMNSVYDMIMLYNPYYSFEKNHYYGAATVQLIFCDSKKYANADVNDFIAGMISDTIRSIENDVTVTQLNPVVINGDTYIVSQLFFTSNPEQYLYLAVKKTGNYFVTIYVAVLEEMLSENNFNYKTLFNKIESNKS